MNAMNASALVLEGHHVGVSHRADGLQAVAHRGRDVGGTAGTGDRGGASRLDRQRRRRGRGAGRSRSAAPRGRACRRRSRSRCRAALVAIAVWKLSWLSSRVSSSCPSIRGAVTRRSGSFSNTTVPSGIASTSPENRKPCEVVEERLLETDAAQVVELSRRRSASLRPATARGRGRRRAATCGAAADAARTARTRRRRSCRGGDSWPPSPARTGPPAATSRPASAGRGRSGRTLACGIRRVKAESASLAGSAPLRALHQRRRMAAQPLQIGRDLAERGAGAAKALGDVGRVTPAPAGGWTASVFDGRPDGACRAFASLPTNARYPYVARLGLPGLPEPNGHGTRCTSSRFVPSPCPTRPAVMPIRSPDLARPSSRARSAQPSSSSSRVAASS